MPVGAFVPSRIHLDYPEWRAPTGSDSGKVWAWNGSGYAPVSLAFDPVGTAAAAVAAHVVAENPHSQYYLASGVSVYGATLIDDADAAAARGTLGLGTMAVATEAEAEKQSGDNRTMGRKYTIPYGLYVGRGFVSPQLAKDTFFTQQDLDLFFKALIEMFEHDRSAARGMMATRKLIVFKHADPLGNAPAWKLFDLVKAEPKDPAKPPREFSDFTITIDRAGCPAGVEIIELV